MNNSAFKDLLSQTSRTSSSTNGAGENDGFKKPATAAAALGSRMRSSIPMTPRNIPGQKSNARSDFSRQAAEFASSSSSKDADGGGLQPPPRKKFKASAAPKGTKLASGYVDRAGLLRDTDENERPGDDREKRLKALEDLFRLQQIDLETLERLKNEIGVGGDVGSTHLVRGLDYKLLARVRRGEDVTKAENEDDNGDGDGTKEAAGAEMDVDDEFDQVLEKEISAKPTQRKQSDEENDDDVDLTLAEPVASSQALSRDEILRRFKRNRNQPIATSDSMKPPPAPVLNDKFKKVATQPTGPKKEKFIETIDGRRREVLLITNPNGTTKRKSRWLDPEPTAEEMVNEPVTSEQTETKTKVRSNEKQPKKARQSVMGMEVPAEIAAREAARKAAEEAAAAEEEDDDIFQGVGDDYDPLADITSDVSEHSGDESQEKEEGAIQEKCAREEAGGSQATKRNYFATTTTEAEDDDDSNTTGNPMTKDPTILAALKRAAEIRKREEQEGQQETTSRSNNRGSGNRDEISTDKSQAFLARLRERDRQDAADLDMGFGESRFDDEDDDGGGNDADLLDFNHDDNDDVEGGGTAAKKGKGAGPRKRGPKKRKGDKNNFADVMGVIAGRRKEKDK